MDWAADIRTRARTALAKRFTVFDVLVIAIIVSLLAYAAGQHNAPVPAARPEVGRWTIFNARFPQFTNGHGSADMTRVVLLDTATGRTYTYDEKITRDEKDVQTGFDSGWRMMAFSPPSQLERILDSFDPPKTSK